MWLLRIWLVVSAAAAAAAVAAAMLTTAPAERDRTAAHGHKLDLVQHNAHLLLKLDQRENIDVVARLSRDPRVVDALTNLNANKSTPAKAQASANAALLDLLAQISADARPELCIALDADGRQLARVGPGESHFTPLEHGLVGYPLVANALRGMLRDDTWSMDGQLYLMAAAPVISRTKSRYVGVLLIGQQVDASYAQRLKERLVATHVPFLAQTDVAFFLRGTQVAATIDQKPLKKLPLQFDKHRAEYLKAERSAPLRVGNGSTEHLVVMAPLRGEAAAHNAFYAIVTPAPVAAGLFGTLGRLNGSDWLNSVVLLSAAAVFLLLLTVGLLLSVAKAEVPLRRLVTDLRRLARGELARLPLHTYGRSHDPVAELVTEALDRVGKRGGAAPAATRAAGAVAEPHDDHPADAIDLEPARPISSRRPAPSSEGDLGLPPPPRKPVDSMPPLAQAAAEPLPPVSPAPPMAPIGGPGPQSDDADDGIHALDLAGPDSLLESSEDAITDHLSSPSGLTSPAGHGDTTGPGPSDFGADLPLLKPIDLPGDDTSMDADTIAEGGPSGTTRPTGAGFGGAAALSEVETADRRIDSAVVQAPRRPPSLDEESDTVMSSVPLHLARSIKDRTPTPALEPRAVQPDPESDSFDSHMEQVFKEFIGIKRSCGESTENLTFERFAAKLRKNRDALLDKYDCKSVRFKVYVKDGKAALKATPIQEGE